MRALKDATPKFKVGDRATCSFREKESNVTRIVTDVFPERDKLGYIIDFYVSADGGLGGKPIRLVQERFFSEASESV